MIASLTLHHMYICLRFAKQTCPLTDALKDRNDELYSLVCLNPS